MCAARYCSFTFVLETLNSLHKCSSSICAPHAHKQQSHIWSSGAFLHLKENCLAGCFSSVCSLLSFIVDCMCSCNTRAIYIDIYVLYGICNERIKLATSLWAHRFLSRSNSTRFTALRNIYDSRRLAVLALSPFKFKLLVLKHSSGTWWRYMVIKMVSVVGKSYFCFLNGEGGNLLSKCESSTFSHTYNGCERVFWTNLPFYCCFKSVLP